MKTATVGGLAMLLATHAQAAELYAGDWIDPGARRSAAMAGAYLRVPIGRGARARTVPVAGLRIAMRHDYRQATAPTARVIEADTLDLRLSGEAGPALFVAGRRATGAGARNEFLDGLSEAAIAGLALGVLAGGILLLNVIDGADGDETRRQR